MARGTVHPLHNRRRPVPLSRPFPPAWRLVAFFALVYGLSWAWWLPLAVGDRLVERGDGWPTHIPGLLGPMVAAAFVLAWTEGRSGLRPWLAAMARLPGERRWRLASLAPLGFLALGVGVVALTSGVPSAQEFIRYSGTGATVVALGLAVIVNAFGEEAGWRGYALPRLQARLGPLRASLLIAGLWALWHAPLFLILVGYKDFSPLTIPGFFVGLTAGSLVLTSIYNGAGGSILAAAVWHGSYNLAAATDAADGTIAAVTTALVIFWAVSLVQRERAGQPALGPLGRGARAKR
jgi:membrane protease YdiL (CAAX protease family)